MNRIGSGVSFPCSAAVLEEQTLTPGEALAFVSKTAAESYEKCWNEGDWGLALRAVTAGLYFRCLAFIAYFGHSPEAYRVKSVDHAAASALRDHLRSLQEAQDGFEILVRCMDDLSSFLALTEGITREPDEQTHLLRGVLLAERLGAWGISLGQVETGQLRRLVKLEATVAKLASQKGRKAQWEQSFAPAARAYCHGRGSVTLGSLVRRARDWGEAERREGRNPGLPGTDKGILKGLKRMEAEGLLAIPRRAQN